jgi:starch-binding outer membrane protein, SusD/RagB family
MKNFKYFIPLMLALLLFATACEDVLDHKNPNVPTDVTFWQTPDDAEKGITAVYHNLVQIGVYSRWLFFRMDLASDEGYSNSPWTELANWTRFIYTNYNFGPGGVHIWQAHYKTIFRTNQVLDNVPNIQFTNETRKNQILGEAKFIRALMYYNMVILWEDIPLVLQTSRPNDTPQQRTEAEVWVQIKQDLTDAIALLPETWPANQLGRATKGAAYGLLAKAHMQTHSWAEARTALQWLVEGPGASLYSLVSNYRDNFRHTSEYNSESLFEISFSDVNRGGKGDGSSSGLGNERPQFYGPRGIGWSDGQPRTWIIDEYKKEMNLDGTFDIRLKYSLFYPQMGQDFPDNNLVYNRTWAQGGWRNDEAFVRKYSSEYFRTFEDYYSPNNFRVLRYADVLLCYAEVINEIEGPQQAVPHLNRVRQRANLAPLENSIYASAMGSKDAFRNRLKMERSLELNHEGVRWADLKRWGMLENQAGIDELKTRNTNFNNFVVGRHHRLPIPQREVDNNPNMNQLSGY